MNRAQAWVEYEHAEYGVLRVLFHWVPGATSDSFRLVARAVEFDLFTPEAVQEELLAAMRFDRLTVS